MEAIYKVIFESGGFDYEKYYTAKGLENEFFIHCADEFLTYSENANFGESRATFADVMKDVRKGGKWDVECVEFGIDYEDIDDVLAFTIEKISIINS